MADRSEIVDAIESLAIHCRPPLMSVDDRVRWVRDWCDDLKGYSIEAIRLGCANWRNGDNPKFPLPGQLRAVIKNYQRNGPEAAANKPQLWGPVSEDEYRQMSLSDKIRHQEILAIEARGKAGPMWDGGRHRAIEDMPREYHEWVQKSANHYAEAKKLRETLKQVEHRA